MTELLQTQENNIVNTNNEEVKKWFLRNFFNHAIFLRMTKDKKAEIAEEILQETYDSKLYRLEMILSSLLATLGLLTNSVPVIIGAMLIAPLLQPIKAFSFAVSTGNKHLYFKAMKMLGLSAFVAVLVAYLITLIVPFADLTNEVLARTSPTIVDLLIALGSGIIAILSLAFKRLSESIAGVAMAVALMPPLCVLWIGLQFMNMDVTMGSGLLFLTNLVAIIVVWVILFYAFGFFPTNKVGKKRSARMTILIVLTIWVLLVPLRKGMQTIAFNFKTNAIIYNTFDKFWWTVNQSIKFQKPSFQRINDEKLKVNATLDIPNSLKITDVHKQELTKRLAAATQKSIELQLNLIWVSSVSIDPPKVIKNTEKKVAIDPDIDQELLYIEDSILSQFNTLFTGAELENLSVNWGKTKDQVLVDLEFKSAWKQKHIDHYLAKWNAILEKYFKKEIIMRAKVQYISVWESSLE